MSAPLLFTPSFRQQKLGWLFIAIVAIMVYIATFAMAMEAALSSVSLSRNQGMANHMTVEIPAVEDESSTPQSERIKQATAVLRAAPDIVDIRVVPDEETERLLAPWISEPELIKKLPLPTLLDIERRPKSTLTAATLETQLHSVVSDARVDDHAAWIADLARLVRSLTTLTAVLIVLTGLAMVIAISLICRAVMATERETVELLHVMGAPDNGIARHFQSHAWRLSWPAALGGFLCAALSLACLLYFIRNVIDFSSMQTVRWVELGTLMVIVPLTAVIAASLSARFSVIRLLQTFP